MTRQWKPAGTAFIGGTAESLKIKGRLVKNKMPLYGSPLYDPIQPSDNKIDVPQSSVGVIANALMDDFLIAYPTTTSTVPPTLERLTRSGAFYVIRVNWPTFRMQFQIET